ncbi:GntR family transcriptional regulator [Nonomuraea sediminis]|uniref:GntR family transcriptional regulator n=1 Tax=Nonomuraea sediminis TaxID=2835864 RepID=UPI0023DF910C|nr:GntR family transcriptional regulator [Nonomuraea sediminis]
MFRRIADLLRTRIRASEYRAGSMFPAESELCREFGVARTTIRRALVLLEGEGLILAIPAKGRVVNGGRAALPYRYQRIAADLRDRIRQREFPEGATLPSEAQLCRRYAVSRNTVRQALAILEKDGWITVKQGSGRLVRLFEGEFEQGL